MACKRHPDREEVSQCSICGAFVCDECAQVTDWLKESCGTLCIDCYCRELYNSIGFNYRQIKSTRTKIIASIVLYLLGIVAVLLALLYFKETWIQFVFIILGIILCGFFTGVSWLTSIIDEQDEDARKNGTIIIVDYRGRAHRDTGFFPRLMAFVFGTIFGVIITPIRLIFDFKKIKKLNGNIASLKDAYNYAISI